MNLIPLLCDAYTRKLTSLANKLKTRSLEGVNVDELYRNNESIEKIQEAIDRHDAIMRQRREILIERMVEIEENRKELSARLEEIKDLEGDASGLRKTYGELLIKLVKDADEAHSELASHDADDAVALEVRNVVSSIGVLKQEYEMAFQKAYHMTN